MSQEEIIQWLLEGDVAIQYQVHRDLLGEERNDLRERIAHEGWGARFMAQRYKDGHWGRSFYQPKWTSTHYTLQDLKNLCIAPGNTLIRETVELVAKNEKGRDGGINPSGTISESDVCINGMFLEYATYFGIAEEQLHSVVDFILGQHMSDGGFNCRFNRSGARHSSMHSTISVAEGIAEYARNGYNYRLKELQQAGLASREFLLLHRLFLSDRTGEVIDTRFLHIPYPYRWRYDILRALDHFRAAGAKWDERMKPALDVLIEKRRKDGRWPLQAKHPGQSHFEMEKAGGPSRWNTLRALRVLKRFPAT